MKNQLFLIAYIIPFLSDIYSFHKPPPQLLPRDFRAAPKAQRLAYDAYSRSHVSAEYHSQRQAYPQKSATSTNTTGQFKNLQVPITTISDIFT
jgi:hypothetical protein